MPKEYFQWTMSRDIYPPPLSKTAKYKKITKPLLERKRRARINRCLDELKDLMVGVLEIDDDNMSKLEKADILELTVNHLTKLHSPRDPVVEAKKFQAGFGQCAAEACRFILALPDLDANVSQNLINHLSRLVSTQPLTIQVPNRPSYSPPISPPSPGTLGRDRNPYHSDRSSTDGELEEASPYVDGYPDDVSQYSASSAWSQSERQPERRMPQLPIKTTPSAKDLASPMAGLLTTVDRVGSPPKHHEPLRSISERNHRSKYFNRVPAECKDVILQKIRQHIMDKRGNDVNGDVESSNARNDDYTPKISVREGLTRDDRSYCHNQVSNDTLDLRKVRTPSKSMPEKRRYSDSPSAIVHIASQPPPPTPVEKLHNPIANESSVEKNKAEPLVNLPEQLAVDYSNLPPKKKRKLLEYQEYKKQEESRRLEEIANRERNEYLARNGHLDRGEYDANNPAWRPW